MTFRWNCEDFMVYPLHYQANDLELDKKRVEANIALIIANSEISNVIERAWENCMVLWFFFSF